MRLCGEEGRAGEVGGDVVSGWTGPGCTDSNTSWVCGYVYVGRCESWMQT